MTRRCRGCGRRLSRPSPDGLGPVCGRRLTPTPTAQPDTPAPATTAGQLELEEPVTDLDRGQTQAATIRTAARELAEIANLGDTGALREILLDLSYALADLSGPLRELAEAWAETAVDPDAQPLDPDVLDALAGQLRHCANNT